MGAPIETPANHLKVDLFIAVFPETPPAPPSVITILSASLRDLRASAVKSS